MYLIKNLMPQQVIRSISALIIYPFQMINLLTTKRFEVKLERKMVKNYKNDEKLSK